MSDDSIKFMSASGEGSGGSNGDDETRGAFSSEWRHAREMVRYRFQEQEKKHNDLARSVREEHRFEIGELWKAIEALRIEIKSAREWVVRITSAAIAIAGVINLLVIGFGLYVAWRKL